MTQKKNSDGDSSHDSATNDRFARVLSIIPCVISVVAIGVSMWFGVLSNSQAEDIKELDEKYNRLDSYDTSLSYTIDISKEDGSFTFGENSIKGGRIMIAPKYGGISKVYAIHYQEDNVKAILPIELDAADNHDAQEQTYGLDGYTIDNIAYDNKGYSYGTLFLVTMDYQNNAYTNMIVFKVNKDDPSDWGYKTYYPIDLLYGENELIKQIPDYDFNQMKEYKSLIEKLDTIL